MKRILVVTIITIACLGGLYAFLTWGSNGNPRFMHHRYNAVVTEPLSKLDVADAQYKMGLFWYYGSGESEPTSEEISNAVYWWEKASAKGNEKATQELAKVKELQNTTTTPLYVDSVTDSLRSTVKTPDGKYEFHNIDGGSGGTIDWFTTYVEYKDARGRRVYKQWDENADDGKSSMGLLTKLWQFKHKNEDYYVAQRYFRASLERSLMIEIFTISDGKPIYHTEFYPEGVNQQVCYTLNYEHEINFDFDPETLTVSYTTYENDYQSEGKKIQGSWKLNLN